ncbi:TetR family transcriptional regulator [Aureimonas sp. AU12]|uniref:TetR family transcriptional regulator n=1 Tax=Aureimonas sp. AU12 TaxID=1638161 RepID=UPI0007826982|nr:TetR family transcriptional regulator [Aureimonas sp. AU12]
MRRTKEAAAETRCAILDAAEQMFFERGVSQTSLSQIAAAANVTRGAIYWHFTGKSALFQAMQERAYLPQEEFFQAQNILGESDPMAALHRVTLESIRRFVADERARRVLTILTLRCEYVGEMAEAMICHREAEHHMHRTVVQVFERARDMGLLRAGWTPQLAANACICIFTGIFTEWLQSKEEFDIVEMGTLTFDGLFAGFRAEAVPVEAAPMSLALAG